MIYRVEISRHAERDLKEAVAFIATDSPAAARAWLTALNRKFTSLKRYPFRCKRAAEAKPDEEIRELLVGRYRVIFLTEERRVVVLAVRPTERLPLDRAEVKRRKKR